MLDPVINFLNDIFWGYVLIYGLLAVGLFFTIRLGFIQFVNFGEMFRVVTGSRQGDSAGISPFQALTTSSMVSPCWAALMTSSFLMLG